MKLISSYRLYRGSPFRVHNSMDLCRGSCVLGRAYLFLLIMLYPFFGLQSFFGGRTKCPSDRFSTKDRYSTSLKNLGGGVRRFEIFRMTIIRIITMHMTVIPSIIMVLETIAALGIFYPPSSIAASSLLINGAGATFPEPIYVKWFSDYQSTHKGVSINYQGIGSGGGIRQLLSHTVDFGATDAPMNEEEIKMAQPSTVLHVPTVMGAVVISYNIGISSPGIHLTGDVLASIFSGKITQWNDARIMKYNKGVSIPNRPIAVVTRSDGSGTTAVFTEYLSKVDPQWRGRSGKTVDWFKGSLGAKGNAGVAGLIKQTEGAIGYIEFMYAKENKLPHAKIENFKKEFVEASISSVSAAASSKTLISEMEQNGFKISVTNSPNSGAYPISSFTWLLAYDKFETDKEKAFLEVLRWTQGEKAQEIAEKWNYAPLPKGLRDRVLVRLSTKK